MRLHKLGYLLTVAILKKVTILRTANGIEVLDKRGVVVLDIPYDTVKYLTDKLTYKAIGYMLPHEIIPETVFLTTLKHIAKLKSEGHSPAVEIRLVARHYPDGINVRKGGFPPNVKERVFTPGPGKKNVVVDKVTTCAPRKLSLENFPNLRLSDLAK